MLHRKAIDGALGDRRHRSAPAGASGTATAAAERTTAAVTSNVAKIVRLEQRAWLAMSAIDHITRPR
jgi:hypothetical protein